MWQCHVQERIPLSHCLWTPVLFQQPASRLLKLCVRMWDWQWWHWWVCYKWLSRAPCPTRTCPASAPAFQRAWPWGSICCCGLSTVPAHMHKTVHNLQIVADLTYDILNNKHHDLYSPLNSIQVIKSREMRWDEQGMWHVWGWVEKFVRDFVGETWKEKGILEDPGIDGMIILKWIWNMRGHRLDYLG